MMTAIDDTATTEDRSEFTIAEAGTATGTSPDTLRYYERAGIMPAIGRTRSGRRVYTADDLGWISFVRRLRSTGMSMQTIAEYTAMVRAGDGTVADRRRMIEDHRATVAASIEELHDVLAVLDRKIEHYEAAEQGVDVGCSDQPLRHTSRLS